jgi:hypothetical protein
MLGATAKGVVPRLAHMHRTCVETQCGWSSSVNDLYPSRRLEADGRGRPARELGRYGNTLMVSLGADRVQVLTDLSFAQK